MRNVAKLFSTVLADAARLQNPTLAASVSAVLVAVLASVAGVNLTTAEVGGWIIAAGAIAATVEKALARKPAPESKPTVTPGTKLP
jgi:hypothetical protein